MQNGQQGPEQTFLNTHHKDILDASEHGDEYDDLRLRIAVLEEKNETLEKKCKTLEKRCEAWEKKFEKLERLIRHQVEQSEEEQFCSTASTQQVYKSALEETAIYMIFCSCCEMDVHRKK